MLWFGRFCRTGRGVSICLVYVERVTYVATVWGGGRKGMVAYAAVAVDCDGFLAGVDGAGASVHWQAVEG